MKINYKKYIVACLCATSLLGACTDGFEEKNLDPNKVTNDQAYADYTIITGFFPQLSRSVYYNFDNTNWKWQVQQNLNGDVFSGYFAPPTPFAGNVNQTHYVMTWNLWPWSLAYENIMPPAANIERLKDAADERLYAASLVLKVVGMHRITDIYGPIPYNSFGTDKVTFDAQSEVYNKFFDELDMAIAVFKKFENEPTIPAFIPADDLFQADFSRWMKFANSLKLRLAMRISNVDPVKAKKMAEEAISNGVFEGTDVAQVGVTTSPMINPLATIAHGWNDIKMGADMESILAGLKDPRLEVYFSPVGETANVEEGRLFAGIRSGVDLPDKAGSPYTAYSGLNAGFVSQTTPVVLMAASEVYFLRAEAALNGWAAGGTTQELYEMGVKNAFDRVGAEGVDVYLADETSSPRNYTDPNEITGGGDYDIAAVSDVKVKFDQSNAMEQILTQKWIAMFPEGMEAWAEFRRTGYPKLFPVKFNKSAGAVPEGNFITRLSYPDQEKDNNPDAYADGVANLKAENPGAGAGDVAGAPLWWDVD